MKTFKQIVELARAQISELYPWDVAARYETNPELLLLDVREACEYASFHVADSILVPRGILETACEHEYEDCVPELAAARAREIIVICRSGNRSVLAAQTLQWLGYNKVSSMKTGLRGWNDYELPLVNANHETLDPDEVETILNAGFSSTLMHPEQCNHQS